MSNFAVKSKDKNKASQQTQSTGISGLYKESKKVEPDPFKSLKGTDYPQKERGNKSYEPIYNPLGINYLSEQFSLEETSNPTTNKRATNFEGSKRLGASNHQTIDNFELYHELLEKKTLQVSQLTTKCQNLKRQAISLKDQNYALKGKIAQYEAQKLGLKASLEEKQEQIQRLRQRISNFEDNDAQLLSVLEQIDTQIEKAPEESLSQKQRSHKFESQYDKNFKKSKSIKERDQNQAQQMKEQKEDKTQYKENSPQNDPSQQIEYLRKRCKTLQKISGIILDESKWDYAQETLMDVVQKLLDYWQVYNETI